MTKPNHTAFTARLSPQLHQMLKDAAAGQGLSVSDLLRRIVFEAVSEIAVLKPLGGNEYALLEPTTGYEVLRGVTNNPRAWAAENGYRLWKDCRGIVPPFMRPKAVVGTRGLDGAITQIEEILLALPGAGEEQPK